jgi:hypothetical protein
MPSAWYCSILQVKYKPHSDRKWSLHLCYTARAQTTAELTMSFILVNKVQNPFQYSSTVLCCFAFSPWKMQKEPRERVKGGEEVTCNITD